MSSTVAFQAAQKLPVLCFFQVKNNLIQLLWSFIHSLLLLAFHEEKTREMTSLEKV